MPLNGLRWSRNSGSATVTCLKVPFSDGLGVILNAAKIGNYCGFNASSLIGNNKSPENKPVIGDYVHFGPGAKAFGKVSIGNHVFVAPNSVLASHDVPDNCIVGGVPAKILSKKIS